ncbi:sulfite exporter TauE/SafE family protein [Cognatishimia sp. F0-27]|uniref:sulfite exporter TauE/SafE family protein n=1 Tax=Cognatishimia sp. F0-27 TaxID=2816855 RepID=UPI001D0CB769|nr:sulfite exporter TauE/SafE family protein [Cognatishimia sp. F0-27]MCC1491192.1 sulfite exporter TauE/SafE family protein [Cognatishimia sp. F0-27]
MNTETALFLVAGALAGGFINGLSGTGMALFSIGFYLAVLDPARAVAVVALMSILVGIQGLWVVRGALRAQPGRALRFVIPGLVGVPLGVPLLDVIEAGTLRVTIAVILVFYGGYFAFRKTLPVFTRRTPKTDVCVGFVGGVLGGAAAISGAVLSMWVSLRPWSKAETRAVLQPFNVAVLATTVMLLLFRGAYDARTFSAMAVTAPMVVVGAQIGIIVFRRLSDNAFRRLIILMTLVLGLGIMVSEIA